MATINSIDHLERIRLDVRDEIKRRIEQRDRYSIQLTIALATIVAVAFGPTGFSKVLIAAPLVSIYFTILILYSYSIHRILARFLRERIEPELARMCGTSTETEWETYYLTVANAVPGIRRGFFLIALWVVFFAAISYLSYLSVVETRQASFQVAVAIAGAIYFMANVLITSKFGLD